MAMDIEDARSEERHPIRFLIKFAAIVGLLYGAGRLLAEKKNEFAGLTEEQAKTKLVEKLGPRVGDETAAEIADQVIPKLKERGLIGADPMEAVADDLEAAADDFASTVEDKKESTADKVTEAVESVVKD